METYDANHAIMSTYNHKYDSRGNMIEVVRFGSNGDQDSKETHEYDKNNRVIEDMRYEYEMKFGELKEIPSNKMTYVHEEY